MPALYALAFRRLLPEHFAVVGTARSEETDESFRERMKEAVQRNARDEFRQDVWDDLAAGMRYCSLEVGRRRRPGPARDAARRDRPRARHARQPGLRPRGAAERDRHASSAPIAERRRPDGWVRLIVEKPFGHDLASAQAR